MGRFIDMADREFGEWKVLDYAGNSKWRCRCSCGRNAVVTGATLRNGASTRCRSCARSENNRITKLGNRNNVTHGKSKTRIYRIWGGIISRCENPNDTGYENYGGRGIGICREWRNDFLSFEQWAIKNGYSDKLSIDRINVDGDYEPGNCRWATGREQENNKRTNRILEFKGEFKTLSQWSEALGIPSKTISSRIDRYGWSVEDALATPAQKGGGKMTSQNTVQSRGFGLLFEMGERLRENFDSYRYHGGGL